MTLAIPAVQCQTLHVSKFLQEPLGMQNRYVNECYSTNDVYELMCCHYIPRFQIWRDAAREKLAAGVLTLTHDDLKDRFEVSLSGEVYELPCHLQPVLKKLYNFESGEFPVAEVLCRRHICLPIFAQMTEEQATYVVNSLKEVLVECS